MPVVMPQPNRHTLSSGASLLILATEISGMTVYSDVSVSYIDAILGTTIKVRGRC